MKTFIRNNPISLFLSICVIWYLTGFIESDFAEKTVSGHGSTVVTQVDKTKKIVKDDRNNLLNYSTEEITKILCREKLVNDFELMSFKFNLDGTFLFESTDTRHETINHDKSYQYMYEIFGPYTQSANGKYDYPEENLFVIVGWGRLGKRIPMKISQVVYTNGEANPDWFLSQGEDMYYEENLFSHYKIRVPH